VREVLGVITGIPATRNDGQPDETMSTVSMTLYSSGQRNRLPNVRSTLTDFQLTGIYIRRLCDGPRRTPLLRATIWPL